MVIYIIDTYGWIEYLIGTEQGQVLRKLFQKNNKFITMECCLSELKSYCLRKGIDFSRIYKSVKKNSVILPVLITNWLDASDIKHKMRENIKDFGLIDSILISKQNELQSYIISGDRHFKGLKNVVYIGP
ncbi:MAG: hypothetical protein AABX00_05800 [Nanoarchaeota archaeon]